MTLSTGCNIAPQLRLATGCVAGLPSPWLTPLECWLVRAQRALRRHLACLTADRESAATSSALIAAVLLLGAAQAGAQTISPSQVTPPSLLPAQPLPQVPFVPEESERQQHLHTLPMSVQVQYVEVVDGFSVLAEDTERLLAPYQQRRITGDEIFALARALEQRYAKHGYVLVRVVVPPQRIATGGVLKLRVVDGFIQQVNADAVPQRLRAAVLRRLRPLVGLHHVLLATLERRLLVAGDLAGLHLTSALAPGSEEGGTRLLVGGTYRTVDGTVSADNRLDRTLGPWELGGSVTLNSLLSLGEQLYGDALVSNPQRLASGAPALRVFGGGALIPVGDEGITLNPEYTTSETRTPSGPGFPATVGEFDRFALRATVGLRWRRRQVLKLNLSAEAVDQQLETPEFGTDLYHDRYRVVRVGLNDDAVLGAGSHLVLDALASRGVGGRGAPENAGVPLSRQGASPDFNKLNASARLSRPLVAGWQLELVGLAQASLGAPLLRSEQLSLDGVDALSAFAAGSLTVDQGATLRSEFGRPLGMHSFGTDAVVSPYVFAADGIGEILRPTALEERWLHANTYGVGARASAATAGATSTEFAFELGRQEADLAGVHQEWRVNLIAGVQL